MASRTCEYCNSSVDTDANFCPHCGAPLPTLAAEPVIVPPAPVYSPTGYNTVNGGYDPNANSYEPSRTDTGPTYYGSKPGVLGSWKTSVGASILGCVFSMACNYSMESTSIQGASAVAVLCAGIIAILFAIFGIVYALLFYPKYFKGEPRACNSNYISFFNLFFGGIIFGCLWNHNLTRGEKGISNIVFVVLIILAFVLGVLAVVDAAMYGGMYGAI